jgi:hypothetical protein
MTKGRHGHRAGQDPSYVREDNSFTAIRTSAQEPGMCMKVIIHTVRRQERRLSTETVGCYCEFEPELYLAKHCSI